MEDQEKLYKRAHERVEAIKGFYIHATVYVLVNLGLFAINALSAGMALTRDGNPVVRRRAILRRPFHRTN